MDQKERAAPVSVAADLMSGEIAPFSEAQMRWLGLDNAFLIRAGEGRL